MSITSIFSASKPLSFFSSKEEVYANRVNEVAQTLIMTFLATISSILVVAAFIYLVQGHVTHSAAIMTTAITVIISKIVARILVSWDLW